MNINNLMSLFGLTNIKSELYMNGNQTYSATWLGMKVSVTHHADGLAFINTGATYPVPMGKAVKY